MKRSAIPDPPTTHPQLREHLLALKENIELLTGVRSAKLTPLSSNATLSDVIIAVNAIINRLS